MAGKDKKSKKLQKVQKDRQEVRAANKPEYVTGTGQKLWRVHLKQDCMHRICDIHNPPQGLPESDWPTHWRADRGLMERICPHGVGHPTKAHMEFLKEMDAVRGTTNAKWEGIHGCDGCCGGNYDTGKDRREPWNGQDEEEEPFELGEEFRPYFDDGSSPWERGERLSWPPWLPESAHIPPPAIPWDPAWVDHDAPANGIGPVCKDCGNLIDWHPDHKLGCPWL